MCGIGGIVTTSGGHADADLLGDSLMHRGRSGRGSYALGKVSLHSSRHAVIALEDARQPLRDAAERFVMVGNGEVLNYRDLVPDLVPARRAALRPGDLQVALELFAEQGTAAFERLRGPFALAVWDTEQGRLTLVRDRMGERPLYYYDDGDEFVFASEVRCLEAALRGRLTHDGISMLSFIGLGRPLGDRTMYREVKSLLPGAVLQVDSGRRTRTSNSLLVMSSLRDGLADPPHDEEMMGLLEQAISRVLVADCPVAVGFSGGVDSSVILKAAMEQMHVAAVITVFSALMPEEDENLRRARAVAELMGVDLVEVPYMLPSVDATLDMLATTLDQPCAEPLVMHNDALHLAAAPHARVLLGGHGADEVFGGYARYSVLAANGGRSGTWQWMADSPWERWNRTAEWPRLVNDIVSDEFAAGVELPEDILGRPFPYGWTERSDPVLFGQALDLFRLMCYDNFRATDENGIARGVEVRSPFFDIDLVAGAFARRLRQRVDPAHPKQLLRQVFEGTLLERSFGASKVGFDDNFPYRAWIERHLTRFTQVIADGPLVTLGVLREGVLPRLSELDWRSQWRLFALSAWLTR